MTLRIAVIGSGLSAIGAIRALLKLGHKPTVIDWGERIDPRRAELAERLAAKTPAEWTPEQRKALTDNLTVGKSRIPKKLLFGSDFFYGRSRPDAPVEHDGDVPPFSYALGGFSVGWGGASMPASDIDLDDWPIAASELTKYCRAAVANLPYSARADGLSLSFDVLHDNPRSLRLSRADELVHEWLSRAAILEKEKLVFGQSRLLTRADVEGCRYCGQCMSGCVYGAIYKSGDEIVELARSGAIEYRPECLVREIDERGDTVTVKYLDVTGHEAVSEFDRVFLAAGAVNSTRIVLSSLKQFDRKVTLKSRGGYVMPVLSLRRLPIDWPSCNTQPGIFLELRGGRIDHWVHVQISTANELVFQKLGIRIGARGLASRIKKFLAEHLLLMFVNFHSDYAGHYQLWVTPSEERPDVHRLHSQHEKSRSYRRMFLLSAMRLLKICLKIGCLPLIPLAKNNSGSYHVGSSLPMRAQVRDDLETDELGRIRAWQRVHIVDTSTFPSLPGTTVGLLTMANAMRVVEKIRW